MRRAVIFVLLVCVVALGVVALRARKAEKSAAASRPKAPVDASYATRVQPIFDRRCVVCHSCYDSPCQLNLQSFAGLDRGANKTPVYHADRLTAMQPTRMFIDAPTTEAWQRDYGFFPVVARGEAEQLATSPLLQLVEQRRAAPASGDTFDIDAPMSCPRAGDELTGFLRDHPSRGMPFGFPPLSDDELRTLAEWIRAGGGGPAQVSEPSPQQRVEIAKWEAFFNAADPRGRIVARYLYEHLFFAHLHFDAAPGAFFRLVRSRTAAPAPIDEIASVRPYDDPKLARPYYRLRKIDETIVQKTHVPYRLNDAKLLHLRKLFLETAWRDPSPALPSYESEAAANPFTTFAAIPARARYQFMLDDAFYHVDAFIHGPVCKGQVALDVIDEHFLIFFLAPDSDPAITDPDYLRPVTDDLVVPAEGQYGVDALYARFKARELAYLHAQAQRLASEPGRTLQDVWNGDGHNPDAVLTVYRHFDNAFVLRGAIGGIPKTAWVLDYPIFERMYYDLVAGFDVFGNVVHQVATRRYMNLLRIEAENQFLRFLPPAARKQVRDSWYRGTGVATLVDVFDPLYGGPAPRIELGDVAQAKQTLITRVLGEALGPSVTGVREPIQWKGEPIVGEGQRARVERALRQVVAVSEPFVRVFPDATLLHVRSDDGNQDLVYTLIRNRSHANIDFMFLENDFLVPTEDTLHAVPGVAVSRPNFFLRVSGGELPAFVNALRALVPGDRSWSDFVSKYGVRRSDAAIWAEADFFNAEFPKLDALNAGVLDLSRYLNE